MCTLLGAVGDIACRRTAGPQRRLVSWINGRASAPGPWSPGERNSERGCPRLPSTCRGHTGLSVHPCAWAGLGGVGAGEESGMCF